jgi:hypothetical protein
MQNELNELRNQVRTLKRMLFGVFGLVVVGGLLAATSLQGVPDVIQAKKIEVVNDDGKVLVQLGNLKGGGVDNGRLVTRNSADEILVELSANGAGGACIVRNKGGRKVAYFNATERGGSLSIRGKDGGSGSSINIDKDGNGSIEVLGVTPAGGSIRTVNGDYSLLVVIAASEDGGGLVETQNGKGVVTSQSP